MAIGGITDDGLSVDIELMEVANLEDDDPWKLTQSQLDQGILNGHALRGWLGVAHWTSSISSMLNNSVTVASTKLSYHASSASSIFADGHVLVSGGIDAQYQPLDSWMQYEALSVDIDW